MSLLRTRVEGDVGNTDGSSSELDLGVDEVWEFLVSLRVLISLGSKRVLRALGSRWGPLFFLNFSYFFSARTASYTVRGPY